MIEKANQLLDEVGIDGWSMRMLARELSVSVSTLYWHVRDKQELLKLMVDDSLSKIEILDQGDWNVRLAGFLREGRVLLRDRPALISLIWGSGWDLGPQTLRITDGVVGLVAESGIPDDEVVDAYYVVIAFLFGFVTMESLTPDTPGFSPDTASSLSEVQQTHHLARYRPAADLSGMDRRFERGIERILNSLVPLRTSL